MRCPRPSNSANSKFFGPKAYECGTGNAFHGDETRSITLISTRLRENQKTDLLSVRLIFQMLASRRIGGGSARFPGETLALTLGHRLDVR